MIAVAVIIIICVYLNNASSRLGVPVLLAFIVFGMMFGNGGLIPLQFGDKGMIKDLCTAALIFIMFYGGFGTNFKSAKAIIAEASLLSTFGVMLTAVFTGLFCHFALGWDWVGSFLLGSVVASTDAATVFSILRGRKLGLKNNSAPLLEVESGSNDPMSYLLTIIMLSIVEGQVSAGRLVFVFLSQLVLGLLFGIGIAVLAVWAFRRIRFTTSGFSSLFILAIALISYSLPDVLGGNGYLSAYIAGIILGNTKFHEKKELVHFFDGVTSLMQVLIFFSIGMLANPRELGSAIVPSLCIFACMMLISRPLTVAILLTPFRKYSPRQQALISFAGLRGASSIVFAIVAAVSVSQDALQYDMFNVAFCLVLLSISVQGFFLPVVAKALGQTDDSDVMRTFTDFADETDLQFTEIKVEEGSSWDGRRVAQLGLPRNFLICQIRKPDGRRIVPNGSTQLSKEDMMICCTMAYHGSEKVRIIERKADSSMAGKTISEIVFPHGEQLLLIQRGGKKIIPNGRTHIQEGDDLMFNLG